MKKTCFNNGWKFCLNDGKDWSQGFNQVNGDVIDLPFDFSIIQERKEDAPSADLTTKELYTSTTKKACNGKCLLVLKKHQNVKEVIISAKAYGLKSAKITI